MVKKYLVPAITTLLAVVAICLLFGDCVGVEKVDGGYNGFEVIFGVSDELFGNKVEILGFSFGAFAALLLVLLGAVLAWLDMIPYNNFISAGLILVGAVLTFLFPVFINTKLDLDYCAKACLIVSGVLSILAAAVIAAKNYINKLLK